MRLCNTIRNGLTRISALVLVTFFLGITMQPANAQISNTGQFMQSNVADANLLIQAYTEPFSKGYSSVASTGWVHRAKPKSRFGFDISVGFGLAVVPESDRSFDLNDFDFQRLRPVNPGNTISPTVSGSSSSGPEVEVFQPVTLEDGTQEELELLTFILPQGSGFSYIPGPTIQGSVGLPYGTEIMLRLIPEVTVGDYGSVSTWGFGFMHSVDQWIPAPLPVDISVMASYVETNLSSGFSIMPASHDADPNNYNTPDRWENQSVKLNSSVFTANVLVGRSLGPLSLYGGFGLSHGDMTVVMEGDYPVIVAEVDGNGNATGRRELDIITDPIDIDYDTQSAFRGVVGASVRLGIMRISADASFADYPVVNAKLSFGL